MSANNPFPNPNNPAPEKKGGPLKIILIIAGVLGVCGVCCCGGFFGLGMFGLNQLGKQMQDKYGTHPEVVARIGEDVKFSYDMAKTGAASQGRDVGNPIQAFTVKGSKGTGEFQVEQSGNDFSNAVLIVDGEEIPLD